MCQRIPYRQRPSAKAILFLNPWMIALEAPSDVSQFRPTSRSQTSPYWAVHDRIPTRSKFFLAHSPSYSGSFIRQCGLEGDTQILRVSRAEAAISVALVRRRRGLNGKAEAGGL
jgi:hypothetical protein